MNERRGLTIPSQLAWEWEVPWDTELCMLKPGNYRATPDELTILPMDEGGCVSLRDSSHRTAMRLRRRTEEEKVLREEKSWRERSSHTKYSIFSKMSFHFKKRMLEINVRFP